MSGGNISDGPARVEQLHKTKTAERDKQWKEIGQKGNVKIDQVVMVWE
jgi:hypothetical protein